MNLSDADLDAFLSTVHATPHRMTMNFAGAGSLALMWLHSVGGSSRTVLEATDRYTPASLIEAVGFTPKRFTSGRVARALAANALERAEQLWNEAPLFGLGCTATIATDRTKRGEHRCAVAVKDALGTALYTLTLTKGQRERAEEEALVSLIMLLATAEACGLNGPALPLTGGETLERSFEGAAVLERLERGELPWVLIGPDGRLETGDTLPGVALLSGSFNPLHDGHRTLAEVAGERLGQTVYFELPLLNADKAPIDLAEARRRALQFAGSAPVILSRAPLFSEKAELFPDSTFVLGADTAARLVDGRFYPGGGVEASLGALRERGARFLVAGRSRRGRFTTLSDLAIPPAYREMFDELPESAFHMDISSSELREKDGAASER